VRWKFGIAIFPAGASTTAYFPFQGNIETHVIDVVGTTFYEFEVDTYIIRIWNELRDLGSTDSSYFPSIVGYSLTTVTGAPSGITNDPLIMLEVSAGSTFEVAVPSLDIANQYYLDLQPESGSAYSFGEVISDYRELCKRLCTEVIINKTLDDGVGATFSHIAYPQDGWKHNRIGSTIGVTTDTGTMLWTSWTFATWLRQAFIGYNGGSRVNVRFTEWGPSTSDSVTSIRSTVCSSDFWNPGVYFRDVADFSKFQIPELTTGSMTTNVNYESCYSVPTRCVALYKTALNQCNQNDYQVQCFIYCNPLDTTTHTASNASNFEIWTAAADDFAVGGFLKCPCVYTG